MRHKMGLSDRLPFTPTQKQAQLLLRYLIHHKNNAVVDEPPFGLKKTEWRAILKLLERIEIALLVMHDMGEA